MRENIITLRVRNARLERGLASRPARTAIRRHPHRVDVAAGSWRACGRRFCTTACLCWRKSRRLADPVEALLGTANVSSFDRAIEAFCGEVASECPRLPTALVVLRFCPVLVALSAVLAVHLAYRVGSRRREAGCHGRDDAAPCRLPHVRVRSRRRADHLPRGAGDLVGRPTQPVAACAAGCGDARAVRFDRGRAHRSRPHRAPRRVCAVQPVAARCPLPDFGALDDRGHPDDGAFSRRASEPSTTRG